MKYFSILKNMNFLNIMSAKLESITNYGILIKYTDYVKELTRGTNYDYIVSSSLVVVDTNDKLGYKIVFKLDENNPTKIDSYCDDNLDGITARLFVDDTGYVGIIVYNLDDEGNAIEDDYFVLCVYEYHINSESTEDNDAPYYSTKYYS